MKLKIGTANALRIVLGPGHQTVLLTTLLSDYTLVQYPINSILWPGEQTSLAWLTPCVSQGDHKNS
jgi:hypothetical protein